MIGFLRDFRVGNLDGKVSIRQSHHIKSCPLVCYRSRILVILGLEPILFSTKLDVALFFTFFSTFNYVFPSIVWLNLINKFISFQKKKKSRSSNSIDYLFKHNRSRNY